MYVITIFLPWDICKTLMYSFLYMFPESIIEIKNITLIWYSLTGIPASYKPSFGFPLKSAPILILTTLSTTPKLLVRAITHIPPVTHITHNTQDNLCAEHTFVFNAKQCSSGKVRPIGTSLSAAAKIGCAKSQTWKVIVRLVLSNESRNEIAKVQSAAFTLSRGALLGVNRSIHRHNRIPETTPCPHNSRKSHLTPPLGASSCGLIGFSKGVIRRSLFFQRSTISKNNNTIAEEGKCESHLFVPNNSVAKSDQCL